MCFLNFFFVLLSGKGHFLMTDHRRKYPKFKFTPRKSNLVSVPTDPTSLLYFALLQRLQDKLRPGLGGKEIKVLLFKNKCEISSWTGAEATANGRGNDRHRVTLCAECSLEYHIQDSWLALTCVILRIISIYPVKKTQPINQATFIVKQIWAVETQLLCSVKWIFSKSQTHKLNFTHHLPLLNFLTRGFGLWMLPHSQTVAQRLSRPSAASEQHQCSCDPATTNRSFRVLFYRGFNFKQRDFWWCFFLHLLYTENRTQDVEFQDIT